MILTISTTHRPATDLGFLLHKHPERVQQFDLPFGEAHLFYPEASETRCTAALLLSIDPVGLVRDREGGTLYPYVNDRPYAASSFMSVAITRLFRSAMRGQSKERPALVDQPIPLVAQVAAVPCDGGLALLTKLWEPLGYTVEAQPQPLDPARPTWGMSPYVTLTLRHTLRLAELLTHLYVLLPVLDNRKHYWVGDDEVEKLLRVGEGWLDAHPERELISHRYLKGRRRLTEMALARLLPEEEGAEDGSQEEALVRPQRLHEQRLDRVAALIRNSEAVRVLDLGCGEGHLLERLVDEPRIQALVGVDVSSRSLQQAHRRLGLDRPRPESNRITLLHGSLTYQDERLRGFDVAAIVEVIEHIDPSRLDSFERAIWAAARPRRILLTTPNAEYNVRFPALPEGEFRHADHRFEWTRDQFRQWADAVASRHGYQVEIEPLGPVDEEVGAPTQLAIFTDREATA
ncbi:MAG: 3' terminal RNA ribose 2'-O-methyltransferase Hen1 [Anaerolineales bacterium]|nr:3' terminal RNA ribose 2'-O-methyltransferase Hen1 [Anaerolineales bacterium]MCB9127084.1 3' terminal RNA ribose 2'-O-methyltransferase Hen1 [Ardenticatenales bacterium]